MKLLNVEFVEQSPNYWVAEAPLKVNDIMEFASLEETIGMSALVQHVDLDLYVHAIYVHAFCVRNDLNALQELCERSKQMRTNGYTNVVIQHCLKSALKPDSIVFNVDLT